MDRAAELAALYGRKRVDQALHLAADSGRFGHGDQESVLEYIERPQLTLLRADERFSVQPGTGAWREFGR